MTPRPPLVTGATGFIGRHLAERLLAEGQRPRLLVRDPARLAPALRAGAELVVADFTDQAALDAAVEGVGHLFHCAANVATWGSWESFEAVNVQGLARLLAAAQGRISGRFVHLSSMDVYGFPPTPQDETAPADGGAFFYGRSKAQGEALLRTFAARHGLEHVVLRPGNVIGPGAQFISRLGDELRAALMLKVGHGRADFGFLYVDNLVDCLLWAAEAPQARGQCFNVRDPVAVDWARFIADLKRGVRGRALVLDLPFGLSDLAARVMEAPWRLLPLPGEPLLHRMLVRIFGRTCGHDIARLTAAGAPLGRVGYEEGMARALDWYRAEKLAKPA